MTRILLTAGLLLVAFFGGRALWRALQSDATVIRGLLTDAVAAFDDADGAALEPFATEYRDTTADLPLPQLRLGLLWVFQNHRDPVSHRFRHRLELPTDDCQVQVEGDRASAVLLLRLHEGLDDRERLIWAVHVTAELERRDGRWRIVRSHHATLSGAPPGR